MNRSCFTYWIVFIAILFLSVPTSAKEKSYRYTIGEVENVYLNDSTLFITDPDTIMHLSYRDSINDKLKYMQMYLNTEARVVILPCIDSGQPGVFSQSLFDTWALEKPDESRLGLMFFVIIGEEGNFLYMVVGDRMETILKEDDIILVQLVTMLPKYREMGIGVSVYEGVKECIRIIEASQSGSEEIQDAQLSSTISSFFSNNWLYITLALVLIGAITFYFLRKRKHF